ncbi:MAG TPA: CDP-alcohol phosphatidyltransferase family protein [Tepidiformaceae bacterium]|nr:CDP-alcohol phosphatidyltransferase family protein [Tepidiformaceae bacterium]
MAYDGLVSRYLNRPLSRPIARLLAPTRVTPNVMTTITLLLAIGATAMTAAGWPILAGIAIHAVSVVDGVDGDLARLKSMATRFGHVFDAVTDRYADALILGGITIAAARFQDYPRPEVVGCLALAGALSVSYSRARIEASLNITPNDSVFGLASRDVRLLIAAVGTAFGQYYWTLVILAVLSALTVAFRLLYLRINNIGTEPVA